MTETIERAVIAAVLLDPSGFPDVADALSVEDFAIQDHRDIYTAMLSCLRKRHAPTIITVGDELTRAGREDLSFDVAMLDFTDVYASYLPQYVERVRTAARRRRVQDQATTLIRRLTTEPDADPVELAHAALSAIDDIAAHDEGPRLYADVIEKMQERLTLQYAGEWEEHTYRSGLHHLDHHLAGGFRPGELIYLAGRPGSGKTALALQMMHNGARRKEPVLLFSGEMSMQSLVERGMSEMTGLPMSVIRKKVLPRDQFDALMKITDVMKGMPVAIDDTAAITTDQMLSRAQRFKRRHGLSAVFFDYVELAGNRSKQGEVQRLGEISRALKQMAMTLDVPVVALSQLNRSVESRTPPIPRMSDLRQSGSLEQDADIVLLLYRPDYYVSQGVIAFDQSKAGLADIYVSKQRNGPEGKITVRFDEASMRFRDLEDQL